MSSTPNPSGAARAQTLAADDLRVLPVDHLQRNDALVLDDSEAPVSPVFDPDPNAPVKRRRGRPAGQKMRLIAESLRHHHFSFLRAHLEDVKDARWRWEHYLGFEGGPDDERHFQLRLRELVKIVTFAAGERGQALTDRAAKAFSGLDLRPPAPHPPKAEPGGPVAPAGAAAEEGAPALPGPAGGAAAAAAPAIRALPLLDEWIEDQCAIKGWNYDDFRQSEWLEMYEEEFGLDQPAAPQSALALAGLPDLPHEDPPGAPSPAPSSLAWSDNTTGTSASDAGGPKPIGTVAERVEHLNVLAFELSKPPTLQDPLGTWLMPELSQRLGGAAINGKAMPILTLANLIDFVNLWGYRWWRHVPRLGEERAKRLMTWLVPQAEELGRPIKDRSQVTHTQHMQAQQAAEANALVRLGVVGRKRFGIVPLDRLAVPADIDGRVAVFRSAEPNTLGVDTDLDAIYAWLRLREDKPKTIEQYGRMMERFYLWCLWAKKKPIGDLVQDDFIDYKRFLQKPPADWVNAAPVPRSSPDWRPLRGAQNENSLRQNFAVVNAFLTAMHKARYLTAQAAAGVMPGLKLKQLRVNIDRSFDDAQWTWVMRCSRVWLEQALASIAEAEQGLLDLAALPPPGLAGDDLKQELDRRRGEQVRLEKALRFRLQQARLQRRQHLVLELGATTGLRLIELVTTRRRSIIEVLDDGERVQLIKVIGKGGKEREVKIYDDILALVEQHHADMDAAGTSFDPTSTRIREVNNPDAVAPVAGPTAGAPVNTDYAPDPESGLVQVPSPPPPSPHEVELTPGPGAGSFPDDVGMRPLVGALSKGFGGENSDRYGSLDPNGLRQALKRFLANCADEAQRAGASIDTEKLRIASTHWMRHFFANTMATDGFTGPVMMETLGHGSLATTTVYLRPERKRLLAEMGKMKRRGVE